MTDEQIKGTPRRGPLSDLKVLDLSRILAGPYLTMCLGDMGAQVIKVEIPGAGDDTRSWGPPFLGQDSAYFLAINRNKESLTVNLKDPRGQNIIRQLVKDTDILVENFRPRVLERLNLTYPVLLAENRKLIMLHISAFGESGPYKDLPGYDILAQAMGGAMSVTGDADGEPVKMGFAIGDLGAAMYGLTGVLAALHERSLTGQGQYLTTSLYETQLAFHINWAMNYFLTGDTPLGLGTAHPNLAPYQAFQTADGHLVLAVGNDTLWGKLCEVLPAPELANDARFNSNANRVRHRPLLSEKLTQIFLKNERDTWIKRLRSAGIPAGPILSIPEIYSSPQVQALHAVQTITHPLQTDLPQVAFPVHFSSPEGWLRKPPPMVGEHTETILRRLGYSSDMLADLAKDRVI